MSLSRIDIKYFKLAVGLDRISKETDVDISARCPVCGDSAKKKRSARLHLYNKGNVTNLNCFNGDCSVHNKTVYSFLRDFYPSLLPQYKKETFTGTMKQLANGSSNDVFEQFKQSNAAKLSKTLDKPELQEIQEHPEVIVQDLSQYLTKITDSEQALNYLNNRGLPYNTTYGPWYYGHQDLKIGEVLYPITGAIVIPLYYRNVMYGFYSRSTTNKSFYTYMNDANIGYKIFNWFNINKEEPVYIYEGIFDSIAGGLSNSIALMGAKLPDARLKELKHPVFVLDNDKTGLFNSLAYAKLGYSVYVQPEKYTEKDMNDLLLNHPEIECANLIKQNLFVGIMAEVRIKGKL